jgi:hypothetical protein
MGITIHYRGRLNNVDRLGALCEELADIARSMGWRFTMRDDDWSRPADARLRHTPEGAHIDGHLALKGIQISPERGAESLPFFFDPNGDLRCPMTVILLLAGTLDPQDAWISVKTQFAPFEVHVWIVGLLKYLRKRYISDLEVNDEGLYWETGDIRILKQKMDFIGAQIERLSTGLSSGRLGDLTGLSADEIAHRIERWFLDNPARDIRQKEQ